MNEFGANLSEFGSKLKEFGTYLKAWLTELKKSGGEKEDNFKTDM